MRRLAIVLLVALMAVAGTLYPVARRIRQQAAVDEARAADLILVLGAAEYRGRPSPTFRARLNHALALYQRGLAPRILTTGGAGGDPDFTEAGVGRMYLILRGVPSEAIVVEPEGDSTMHSTAAAAEIMRRMGLNSCILVSDGYHIYRAKRMLEARGVKVHGSPWSTSAKGSFREEALYYRQAVGYLLWSVGITI
jgi:uncharacterized SAM-binding protein YcdF (DUF218 family)